MSKAEESEMIGKTLAAAVPPLVGKTLAVILPKLSDAILLAVKEYLQKNVSPLVARLDALEQSPMSYEGAHEQGKAYQRHAFVTHRGSLWHCNHPTASTPGDGGPAWTLAVKAGRDGKDAR